MIGFPTAISSWVQTARLLAMSFTLAFLFINPKGEVVCAASLQTRTLSVRLFASRRPLRRVEFLSPIRISLNGQPEMKVEAVTVEYDRGGLKMIGRAKTRLPGKTARIMLVNADGSGPITLRIQPNTIRQYKGRLVILPKRTGEIEIINKVGARDYVNSVVGAEAPLEAPAEMLKAQAVLTQTLLERVHANEVIDDSTQTQIYKGAESERTEAVAAASKVWGQQLTFQRRPVKVFYHSTCAGGTSSAATYFHLQAGSLPYLRHVECNYCKDSPFWKPKFSRLPKNEVKAFSGGALPVVREKDVSDRPIQVKMGNGKTIEGYQFWLKVGQKFGWDKVPGTRFSLLDNGNGQVIFSSTGAGHGVGLCQWGAVGMAKEGKTYQQILEFYYPGCKVE